MATSFKPPSKSLTPRDYLFIMAVVFAFIILSAGLYVLNQDLAVRFGGGGEFFMPWVGGRAFMFDHFEPYSTYVPGQVQSLVYDRAARAGDEPYILDIPFHLLLLYFPFSLLADPQLARVIFTLIVEFGLFAFALLSLRLTEWDSPRFFAVLFFVFCVINTYTFQAVIESSPILLLGLLYAGILLALRAEQDELAGTLIAFSFYHWEIGGPFILLVLIMAIHQRRTRILAGFGMVTFILLAISFLIYPDWLIPFFRAALTNLRADFGFSPQAILADLWPTHGRSLAWVIILLLLIALGYEWSIARASDFRRFYWASCLTIAATPLLGVRSEMENLAILSLPLAFVFAITHHRWRRYGGVFTFLLLLITFSVPWLIYFFAVPIYGKIAEEILYLFLPVFTVLGIYWIRWWAIRPPRVWYDLARKSQTEH